MSTYTPAAAITGALPPDLQALSGTFDRCREALDLLAADRLRKEHTEDSLRLVERAQHSAEATANLLAAALIAGTSPGSPAAASQRRAARTALLAAAVQLADDEQGDA